MLSSSIVLRGKGKYKGVSVNKYKQLSVNSPFTGRKKRKAWNKTRGKYMPEERRQNLAGTDRASYYNQEEWLREFLDDIQRRI